MATKLFLRASTINGISNYYDMLPVAGSSTTEEDVVTAVASGTEIQWTVTEGRASVAWISGRAPVGGFTLTTTDVEIRAVESGMGVNAGGRYRIFKRTLAGIETELLGGPFDDGVEFDTSAATMSWVGNPTDTVFLEDDRILVKFYITNIGTMGAGNCSLRFDGDELGARDSFFNIAETVTFKPEGGAATLPSYGFILD